MPVIPPSFANTTRKYFLRSLLRDSLPPRGAAPPPTRCSTTEESRFPSREESLAMLNASSIARGNQRDRPADRRRSPRSLRLFARATVGHLQLHHPPPPVASTSVRRVHNGVREPLTGGGQVMERTGCGKRRKPCREWRWSGGFTRDEAKIRWWGSR